LWAKDILGPNYGSVKGKTTRQPTQQVNLTWTKIPEDILEKYGEVTLAVDIISIKKIPFMITTSRRIHFGTAKLTRDKTKKTIMTSIQQVVSAYHVRGFRVCNILVDGGFDCVGNNLADMGIPLNVASKNEHIPEVKRYIRTIK